MSSLAVPSCPIFLTHSEVMSIQRQGLGAATRGQRRSCQNTKEPHTKKIPQLLALEHVQMDLLPRQLHSQAKVSASSPAQAGRGLDAFGHPRGPAKSLSYSPLHPTGPHASLLFPANRSLEALFTFTAAIVCYGLRGCHSRAVTGRGQVKG